MARLIGVQVGARPDDLGYEIDAIGLLPRHRRHGAPGTLASHDDDTALASLVFGEPAVLTVLLEVGRPDVAADVGAIHFNGAGERGASHLAAHRLTKLVAEHEGGPVLHVKIAAELQSADAL